MKYRVLFRGFNRYDVDCKKWWWPYWININQYYLESREQAIEFAKKHKESLTPLDI